MKRPFSGRPGPWCLADLVGVGVFAALSLAFVFGLVVPLGTRERVHAAHVEAVRQQKQKAAVFAAQAKSQAARNDAARARLASSPLQIRPVDALNERLAALVSAADACGLSVQDLKPGDGARVKRYWVLPIRLAGDGRFPTAVEFLRELHARMPDVGVRSIKLTAAPDAGAHCELELRWFAAPPAGRAETAAVTP